MDKLANMIAFVTVAETNSFAETAKRLHIANSVVSKRIKDLEDHLGAQLLHRTTRHIALTDAGYAYVEHARRFLDELAEVEENLRHRNENPVGDIRLAAPLSFGNKYLGPAVASFLEAWPDVTVRLIVNAGKDGEGLRDGAYDLMVTIGDIPDSGLITKKLAQSRRVAIAAPEYIAKHGKPAVPEDLARHNCLSYTGVSDGKSWPFQKNGRSFLQRVNGRFVSDSGALLCEAAVRGCGIALLPTFIVAEHVMAGRLEIMLEDFEQEALDIRLVYPHQRHLATRTRKLIDHLSEYFRSFEG